MAIKFCKVFLVAVVVFNVAAVSDFCFNIYKKTHLHEAQSFEERNDLPLISSKNLFIFRLLLYLLNTKAMTW